MHLKSTKERYLAAPRSPSGPQTSFPFRSLLTFTFQLQEISMGSVHIEELSIEDFFGKRPISSRDHGPSFRRTNKQTVPGTMSSSGRSISSDTASVHSSPSSLIPKASLKCFSIKEGFVKAQIPGDIEALILDTSVQPAINNALGSVSVDQTVAVNSRKNKSAVVGREGKKQLSDFDRGSMSWFGMCFRGSVQT